MRVVPLLLLLLVLSGCQAPYRDASGKAVLVPLPAYPPGTVVVHRSGLLEEVVENDGTQLLWANNRNRSYAKPANFIAPYAFSETSERRYRQEVYLGNPDDLWPLGRGEWVYFGVLRTYEDGRTVKRVWRCRDRGISELSYRGRSEPTLHVRCTVYRPGFRKDYPRLQKDYYYSPALRHLRLTETRDLRKGGKPRRDWVLDLLPPERATVGRINALLESR